MNGNQMDKKYCFSQNYILLIRLVKSKNSGSFTAQKQGTMKKSCLLLLIFSLLYIQPILAQNADFMQSIGKIYVVVAVIAAIFIGIVVFLIYLDRKLTKLENQIKDHDPT